MIVKLCIETMNSRTKIIIWTPPNSTGTIILMYRYLEQIFDYSLPCELSQDAGGGPLWIDSKEVAGDAPGTQRWQNWNSWKQAKSKGLIFSRQFTGEGLAAKGYFRCLLQHRRKVQWRNSSESSRPQNKTVKWLIQIDI